MKNRSLSIKKRIELLNKQLREVQKAENEKLGALIRKLYYQNKSNEILDAVKAFFEHEPGSDKVDGYYQNKIKGGDGDEKR